MLFESRCPFPRLIDLLFCRLRGGFPSGVPERRSARVQLDLRSRFVLGGDCFRHSGIRHRRGHSTGMASLVRECAAGVDRRNRNCRLAVRRAGDPRKTAYPFVSFQPGCIGSSGERLVPGAVRLRGVGTGTKWREPDSGGALSFYWSLANARSGGQATNKISPRFRRRDRINPAPTQTAPDRSPAPSDPPESMSSRFQAPNRWLLRYLPGGYPAGETSPDRQWNRPAP